MEDRRKLRAENRRKDTRGPGPVEPEPPSSLLREARGWSGSARQAHDRVQRDQMAQFLGHRRRQGPGQ